MTEAVFTRLRDHAAEYVIEAALLGLFMLSAGLFTVILFHPASMVAVWLPNPVARRALMGVAMGGTAIALIYSPMGRRSGAHYNPAVTLTFWRLGRVHPVDAAAYVAFQFLGGILGTMVALHLFGPRFMAPEVGYVATLPGAMGVATAFAAEIVISFFLMTVILRVTNAGPRFEKLAGVCAGVLVATYILVEAPLSGMSMNPARSFGPAVTGHLWTALWIYFLAPPLGMLLAAELHRRRAARPVFCAKLRHDPRHRCIFCEYHHQAPAA